MKEEKKERKEDNSSIMMQRSRLSYNSKLHYMFEDDELDVASIILEIPTLVVESDSGQRSLTPFSWGAKRKRSAGEPSTELRLQLQLPTCTPSPSPHVPSGIATLPFFGSAVAPPEPEGPPAGVKVEALSPATPLAFSPSESDEKLNGRVRRKPSLKKPMDDLSVILDRSFKRNEFYKQEIQKWQHTFEQLKDANLMLKARKEELSVGVRAEEPLENWESLDLQTSLGPKQGPGATTARAKSSPTPDCQELCLPAGIPSGPNDLPRLSFMMDKAKAIQPDKDGNHPQMVLSLFSSRDGGNTGSRNSASSGLGEVSSTGNIVPCGGGGGALLFDLNSSPPASNRIMWRVESSQALVDNRRNLSKAMAAQARQRRMQICRDKNSNGIAKLRASLR